MAYIIGNNQRETRPLQSNHLGCLHEQLRIIRDEPVNVTAFVQTEKYFPIIHVTRQSGFDLSQATDSQ